MNNYVSAIRWWVMLPLAVALLEPYFDFMGRFCFSLHFNTLGAMFHGMAFVTVLIDLPAVLGGFALAARFVEPSWL